MVHASILTGLLFRGIELAGLLSLGRKPSSPWRGGACRPTGKWRAYTSDEWRQWMQTSPWRTNSTSGEALSKSCKIAILRRHRTKPSTFPEKKLTMWHSFLCLLLLVIG